MSRFAGLFVALFALSSHASALPQGKGTQSTPKLADGVYAVLREGLEEKALLPLKEGEAILTDRHPYLPKKDSEPPRFMVVRSAVDVALELDGEPKTVKEGAEVIRILLKLQPKAAKALEELTRINVGKLVTIVVGGEVVTTHKIRTAIEGGMVQITSCTPGAANYLVERLTEKIKKQKP
jgi:preprotein translocase subunit SecD